MHRPIRSRLAALAVGLASLVGAAAVPGAPAGAALDGVTVQGSIERLAGWGFAAGDDVELLGPGGSTLASEPADAQGAVLFKGLEPADGYALRTEDGTSEPVEVLDADVHPDPSSYDDIEIDEGYGYIPTRDGTLLSANVVFPSVSADADGPWPVLVVYSGYDPSDPGGLPAETQPYLFRGYVVVGVNMRGSGCSGGDFDYNAAPTGPDGYDVIEALARQPWSNGRVGMIGISYSAISQLYVAATQPPHLEAITPVSAYSNAYHGILYPGGIRNEGFALEWALDRQAAAQPLARGWARRRVEGGDTTCADNQVLRLQSRDMEAEITPERFADLENEYLDIGSFADRIEVPTYLGAQFQDEQTGGSAAWLAETLQGSASRFRGVFSNGTHVEPMGPTELPRVAEFVDFYVGRQVPDFSLVNLALPSVLEDIFGGPIETVPNRFGGMTYDEALAAYEAEPPVRVRWEVGGVAGKEGLPYATADGTYDAWPVPGTAVDRWYLQPDGALAATPPTVADGEARATSSYRYDPDDGRASTFDGGSGEAWLRHPDHVWETPTEGTALTFTTPPAAETRLYAGNGSVDLWMASTAADTDVEVVLTEVRPDGHEVYVQSGWLRASRRHLDETRSTPLAPYSTHLEEDAEVLPAGELVPVRIALFPFAHAVRPGSRLRLSIEAPGGNQVFWEFTDLPGDATNTIGHSAGRPSSVALPLIDDPDVVAALPAAAPSCAVPGVTVQAQSLRNQPCRDDRPPRRATAVTIEAGPGPGSATVRWTAPPQWPGADGPDGYDVALSDGTETSVAAGVTEVTLDGLPRGVPLTVVVTPVFAAQPGVASSASPPVTLRTPAASFVAAAYQDLVGRPPTEVEEEDAATALTDGTATRRDVLRQLVRSPEWSTAIVERMYLDTLGRPGDPGGVAFWADRIRTGTLTVAAVASRFYASPEYFAGRGGGTVPTWVDDLYLRLLGRPSDAAGRAYWSAQTEAQGRVRVALRFFQSSESARARVRSLYDVLLGRAPDAGGLAFWSAQVVVRGDLALAVDLASSAEYGGRAERRFP